MRSLPAVLFITGATGQIGSALVERALAAGSEVRALVRGESRVLEPLQTASAGRLVIVRGNVDDPETLRRGLLGASAVVNCAAKVGDWGDPAEYRHANVEFLRGLIEVARTTTGLERFVHISSLGVYEPRDHFGTDETEPACSEGFDAYTRTKAEAEGLARAASIAGLPMVILRPGFVYGPRDRHLLPSLAAALAAKRVFFFGDGEQKLDQVCVRNLVEAIGLALTEPAALGETFNVTDDPLVTRRTFISTVARGLGLPEPTTHLPRWTARPLANVFHRGARLFGAVQSPPLSMARYKFMALNLDYSIEKAKKVLGYVPPVAFADGMAEAIAWYQRQRPG